MVKSILTTVLLCTQILLFSQKVTVSEASEKIGDTPRTGMAITLKLSQKMVENGWEKFLKDHGKYDSKKNEYTQVVGEYKELSGTPVRTLSKVLTSKDGSVTVFWAIDMGNEYLSSKSNKWSAAEKLLHDFGVAMYIQDVNQQVKEAEEAVADASKKQEKKIREGENLVKKVENNKDEKVKLEQKLKDNAQELIDLQKSQDQNKLDQTEAAKDVEKMKKAVEVTKQKLKNIE